MSESEYKRIGGTNQNLPAMTSWSIPDYKNLTFIHCHKSGGTTVKMLLAQAKTQWNHNNNNNNTPAEIQNFKYSFGGGSSAQKQRNQEARIQHIQAMATHQLHTTNTNAIVTFTVVRDPLERFVSAVQQVMHYNTDFRTKCLKWTARATVQCAIHEIQTTNYLRDVHLLPMVAHFRLWDDYPTARLAVLHLHDLPSLAAYLHHVVANNSNSNSTLLSTTMPHGRDRSKVDYATSRVLANMSIKRHCTPEMIQQLCQLYSIDVIFMQSLGYASEYCHSHSHSP
ncbi:expressed unknown protein [Seminavis robusta]|uniref:Sulfotransferase n=1 Tax=Seminavis robusta TaxID=568900 RepID=A0A9N8H2R4_9STRA|nr:expressed unknown protein [Seminavis robusta]|eukprot:Sro71_g039420.1 n/a (282) ;mRNA; r:77278-78123